MLNSKVRCAPITFTPKVRARGSYLSIRRHRKLDISIPVVSKFLYLLQDCFLKRRGEFSAFREIRRLNRNSFCNCANLSEVYFSLCLSTCLLNISLVNACCGSTSGYWLSQALEYVDQCTRVSLTLSVNQFHTSSEIVGFIYVQKRGS